MLDTAEQEHSLLAASYQGKGTPAPAWEPAGARVVMGRDGAAASARLAGFVSHLLL